MERMESSEKVEYAGKMFEIVTWEGLPGKVFEKAVRAPGIRILAEVMDNGIKKVVLTKEVRREAQGIDYRLPGGKVFDSLNEYRSFSQTGQNIEPKALEKAKAEAKEEAGVEAGTWQHLGTSSAGASVDWDLHYFLATDVTLGVPVLEEGEEISGTLLVGPQELYQLLVAGKVQEGRTAEYLWKWLATNKFIEVQK